MLWTWETDIYICTGFEKGLIIIRDEKAVFILVASCRTQGMHGQLSRSESCFGLPFVRRAAL